GDHAVPQRPGRDDGGRCTSEHLPRLLPDGVHLAGLLVHRHDRRLEEDDPLAAAEDHGVRRPKVYGEIRAGYERRQSHGRFSPTSTPRPAVRAPRSNTVAVLSEGPAVSRG